MFDIYLPEVLAAAGADVAKKVEKELLWLRKLDKTESSESTIIVWSSSAVTKPSHAMDRKATGNINFLEIILLVWKYKLQHNMHKQ